MQSDRIHKIAIRLRWTARRPHKRHRYKHPPLSYAVSKPRVSDSFQDPTQRILSVGVTPSHKLLNRSGIEYIQGGAEPTDTFQF